MSMGISSIPPIVCTTSVSLLQADEEVEEVAVPYPTRGSLPRRSTSPSQLHWESYQPVINVNLVAMERQTYIFGFTKLIEVDATDGQTSTKGKVHAKVNDVLCPHKKDSLDKKYLKSCNLSWYCFIWWARITVIEKKNIGQLSFAWPTQIKTFLDIRVVISRIRYEETFRCRI